MQYRVISVIFTPSVSPLCGGETSPPICRGRLRGGKKTIIEYNTIRILILLFLTSIIQVSIAQIITVKQDGTGDYTTIQQAVDASINGDTVLVYPGTYFENINYNGKNITVASLFLITGDDSYIDQTIIDGDHNGSCVTINSNESNAILCGFSIIHGIGWTSGKMHDGGGIYIIDAVVTVKDCIIKDNFVNRSGGGIFCHDATLNLSNVYLQNNRALFRGGGIVIGGDESNVIFDTISLCNIYNNYGASGADIYISSISNILFAVDTFTVLNPSPFHIYCSGGYGYPCTIECSILNAKLQTINTDLYVSPEGDNSNSGITTDEPLKNIYFALSKIYSDTLNPKTIHLANGIYDTASGEKFPLNLRAYVNITGESRDSTILDAHRQTFLLYGNAYTHNYSLNQMTIRNGNGNNLYEVMQGAWNARNNHNVTFNNLMFTENKGYRNSCGAFFKSNNALLQNVELYHNYGGMALTASTGWETGNPPYTADTVRIINCRFRENLPDYDTIKPWGGAVDIVGSEINFPDSITCYFVNCEFSGNYSHPWHPNILTSPSLLVMNGSKGYLINCTFGDNSSFFSQGASIGIHTNSTLNIYNSILYNNYPAELYMYSNEYGDSDLNIYNSLIEGGEEGIRLYSSYNNVYYDPTNIDTDPLWDTAGFYHYALTAASPCIDAGTLNLPPGIELPETDLAGNPRISGGGIDMGAYEYIFVGLPELPQKKPQPQLKVAPNPFNYGTYISYITKESGHVKIEVYEINGRKVSILMDVRQLPGSGKLYWDGTDDYGRKLPAGNYLLKLIINNNSVENVKLVKIK